MIDLIDVSNALASVVASSVYPSGTGAAPVAANVVRIFPGWPDSNQLATDLAAGNAQVSIYSLRTERSTTAGSPEWVTASINAPTLTASVSGKVATFGGTVSTPQNAMIAVNGKPYVYAVKANDTLASIAAALAVLISADIPASASGASVTIATAINIKAAIGVQGIAVRELRRQAKQFQVTVWANQPDTRDTLAANIDVALAKVPRLPLAYGFAAHMVYKGSHQDDGQQKAGIYRRDMMFEIDYPTVETEVETTILGTNENVTPQLNTTTIATKVVWST